MSRYKTILSRSPSSCLTHIYQTILNHSIVIMFSTLISLSLLSLALITPTVAQNGVTTRYWDCCKPSCSWPGKASVSEPVRTCNKQDVFPSPLNPNAVSACGGGTAYQCSNNGPWAVNANLAYGFAAAKLAGKGESNWCCACYE